VAGVIADRVDKRRLILITQSLAAVQAVVLAAVVTFGVVRPGLSSLWRSCSDASMPSICRPANPSWWRWWARKDAQCDRAQLAAFIRARVMGPAIAGIAVATVGEGACFWINAVSYLVVDRDATPDGSGARIASAVRRHAGTLQDGVRYVQRTPPIRNLLILLGVMCSRGSSTRTLLPVYARTISPVRTARVRPHGSRLWRRVVARRRCPDAAARSLGLTAQPPPPRSATAPSGWRASPGRAGCRLMLLTGFACGFGLIFYVATTRHAPAHGRGRVSRPA